MRGETRVVMERKGADCCEVPALFGLYVTSSAYVTVEKRLLRLNYILMQLLIDECFSPMHLNCSCL